MEPRRSRVRPTHVRSRLAAAAVVLGFLVTLVGCGSASSSTSAPGPSARSSASGDCAGDQVAFPRARPVGAADVDGDGTPDAVRLTAASRECPARLVAHVGGGYVGGELPGDDPAPPVVFGVRLAGHPGDLVVTRQDHPRGGYQLHVFARGPDGLVELVEGDQPLVPFVATDTRPIPYAVGCAGSSIVVTRATAEPSGRWDVRRTTYVVTGTTATRSGADVVASDVDTGRADRLMLPGATVFAGCLGTGAQSVG